MNTNQVMIKKEISKLFLRMGVISLFIGLTAIFVGTFFADNNVAILSVNYFPLLLSMPIIVMVNWLMIRKMHKKIKSDSCRHD